MRFKRILILLVMFAFTAGLHAGDQFQWKVGEKLVYKVRWAFIRLGTLEMHLSDTVRVNGHLLYKIDLKMDSNPVLLFVKLHNRYQCLVDSLFRPVKYVVKEKNDDDIRKMIYWFDYDRNEVTWQIFDAHDTTKIDKKKTFKLDHYMYDGISLTYFARGNARENATFKVYSFINDRTGPVDMHFRAEPQTVHFDPLDRDFNVYIVEGMFHLKGIAGVTGKYIGWFTHDNRRIPLGANMKVFVGNVKVELEDWEGWNP
ncbi:hypothetical protein DRI50_03170 [candidate division KSB1 bacterium]|nr:MAG: hypothetical protein DRI50_03170 [candidate division KSB1 bacterium]